MLGVENVKLPLPLICPLRVKARAAAEPMSTEVFVSALNAELMIFPVLLTRSTGGVRPPNAIVPPLRVSAAEPAPMVTELASTVPLTVMDPEARPNPAPRPKLRTSFVDVVMLTGTVTPVASVLQPCVLSPMVGAAQVPAAVPKPAVTPSLSQ